MISGASGRALPTGANTTLLRQMLAEFRVAFRKRHTECDYILPARLEGMPPEKKWPGNDFITIEYTYDFMPRGILNQVSAELSEYILADGGGKEEVWNDGVNFAFPGSECQLTEDFLGRKIIIRAKGPDGNGLMMLVMDALRRINRQYAGIGTEIWVPCNCAECRDSGIRDRFDYSKLQRLLQKGRTTVRCNESGEDILIEVLIRRAGVRETDIRIRIPEAMILPEALQKPGRKIRLFLASSNELAPDRLEFERFIYRRTKDLIDRGIFIELCSGKIFRNISLPAGCRTNTTMRSGPATFSWPCFLPK